MEKRKGEPWGQTSRFTLLSYPMYEPGVRLVVHINRASGPAVPLLSYLQERGGQDGGKSDGAQADHPPVDSGNDPAPEPAPVLPYGAPLLSAAAYGLIVSERKYITSGSVAL